MIAALRFISGGNAIALLLGFLLLFYAAEGSSGYKLNVPRVLLPFHPKTQASYTLEVSGGGCFTWRSSRPEVVSVEPIDVHDDCAERAVVTARTVYEEEQSSVVIAENKDAGVSLTCVVIVDVIDQIVISTVSSVLFVDAAPAQMIVEALNKEGHRFFNLTNIPFDWYFEYPDGGKPVRIVPFAQSKYEAPLSIQLLESEKLRGSIVLVEGVNTGFARLSAKFAEQHFASIPPNVIDLSVVANVILSPSHDIYLPVHAAVHFGALIIKQNGLEDITLPSADYQLNINNPSIATLETSNSVVTAVSLGRAEVSLIDRHVKPSSGIKPQSTHIYVSEPDAIVFTINRGNVWYLQSGLDYQIQLRLQDSRSNDMYITSNMIFKTEIPTDHFTIVANSANGTYFTVIAKKTGVFTLKSVFSAIKTPNGFEPLSNVISAEQPVTISAKLEAKPYFVAFPYHLTKPYVFQLTAIGGTGSYRWSTSDSNVATVDESRGRLTSGALGETVIRVEDVFNVAHFALVHVYVLEPVELRFGESHVEAEVNEKLVLNIRMSGLASSGKLIPFADCRNIAFKTSVGDVAVFRKEKVPERSQDLLHGCATVPLIALSSGDTFVKLSFDKFETEITISAFPPLSLSVTNDLLLARGSEFRVDFTGGPRPWILEKSKYFTAADSSVSTVSIVNEGNAYTLQCGPNVGETEVTVKVGNKKSSKNPLPVVSTTKINVCCAQPQRIVLTTKPVASAKNVPPCPAFTHSVYHSKPATLELVAWGVCGANENADERLFDSLSSVKVKYSVAQTNLLTVKALGVQHKQPNRLLSSAIPKSHPGTAKVTAHATFGNDVFESSLSLNLVDHAVALPPSVVLWNAKAVRGTSVLSGGSGHFWIDSDAVADYIGTNINTANNQALLEVHPKKQGVVNVSVIDLCIEGSRLDVSVKVTDVTAIRIQVPELLEVGSSVSMLIEVLDVEGYPFSLEDVKMMELHVEHSHEVAELRQRDLLTYELKGTSVGINSISAMVRSSTGQVVRSISHQVQVFAPLRLLPSVVTLIPESVFQFEIIGGPRAQQADIQFVLNTSGIATVTSNGLITSNLNRGETDVTAAVTTGGNSRHIVARDSARIRVVSLAGVRIIVSSVIVETGDKIWATVHGLNDAETPFSFGGAQYPLTVQWKLSSKENLVFESPLTEAINELASNRFTVHLDAQKAGVVRLECIVRVHSRAAKHFVNGATVFKDTIELIVQDSLRLPSNVPKALLLTPSTSLELNANRPSQHTSFKIATKSSVASLVGRKNNILQSGPSEGSLPLQIIHHGSAFNETAFVSVDVLNVYSLYLTLEHSLSTVNAAPIAVLPQGITVRLQASFRDQRGRVFDATSNVLHFRPHRFDLTDIVAKNGNRTLDITLKRVGETVIQVWDPSNPRISAFIRLPVGDIISPAALRDFFVGDLVCFESPVGADLTWTTTGGSNHVLRFLKGNTGCSVLNSAGETSVFVKLNPSSQNATTFSTITVHLPDVIVFTNEPKLVSNIVGKTILFPVRFGARANESLINTHGCSAKDMTNFADVIPPFECSVGFRCSGRSSITERVFAMKAVFDTKLGSYACQLRDLPFDVQPHHQFDFDGVELVVSAAWNEASHVSVSVAVPFFPRFIVHDSEVLLNNLGDDVAILSITAVSGLEASIRVEPCAGNFLTVERITGSLQKSDELATISGNMHFKIILNVHSAALWAERASKCEITVSSILTEQADTIPVNIKLHGDVAKAAIIAYRHNGVFGFFTYTWEQFFPFVATLILAVSAAMLFFTYRRALSGNNDISMYNPQNKIGGNNLSYSFSGVKPLFSSTPENHLTPAPAAKPADTLAAKFRNRPDHRGVVSDKLFEEQSSLNSSIGSSMDPNSWANDSRLGVLNRRYR